jgi:hypothetical protein
MEGGDKTLYIANTTKQPQEVYYRLDFTQAGQPEIKFRPANKVVIQPGRQMPIGGFRKLHMMQVESIVQQLTKHGLIGTVDVPRHRGKIRYVFSVDKPVPSDLIQRLMDQNDGILVQEGALRRKHAAIVVNDQVAKAVEAEFQNRGIPKDPTQDVDVEVEQLEQSEMGETRIEEGVRVRADAPEDTPQKPRVNKSGNRRGMK